MKNSGKILRTVLLVILVAAVTVVVLIHLLGNIALKTAIEAAAGKTLNVRVSVGDADLSIMGGTFGLQKLVIGNPPGYQHDKLLEADNIRVSASIGSLLTDTVEIKEITLDGIDLVIEQGLTSNNLQDIIKAVHKSKEKAPSEETKQKPSKKLHIEKLEITNITVKAKLLPVPGKTGTVTLKLEPIRMTNLGSDNKLDTAVLSAKIMTAIAAGVAKQGAGILPEAMTSTMQATLNKTMGLGKTTAEETKKLLEKGGQSGKELIEGFKGLLKPKEKKE
jgi:hypothetical protein